MARRFRARALRAFSAMASITATTARRTLVLADLHLTRHTPRAVSADLARLVRAHPGARLVFAGDLFDLSADDPGRERPRAVRETLEALPEARAAFAEHLDRGGELWMAGGNHDADVADDAFRAALATALGAGPEAMRRLATTPWFFREGGLHVEHGHFYDPDNAPEHPLVVGEPSLGVHFVEKFIAPTGAHRYLNANDGTPLGLFLSAFTWYGPRGPYVVYRFFHAAFAALLRSGPFYRASAESGEGRSRERAFAGERDVPADLVASLVELGATPTLRSFRRTFARLYLDRVAATVSLGLGLAALARGHRRAGAAAVAAGAAVMLASWLRGYDRYTGSVAGALRQGAERVASATGAKLVVFGHTHREAESDAYANTGSFAFPRGAPGRPFLEIEGSFEAPRAVRRYLGPAA